MFVVKSDRTLHRYVITGSLGSGGFGDVFRARLVDLGIDVALKRFRASAKSASKILHDWENECVTHQALSHPNILQSYDAFEAGGFFYHATELASHSLDHYIQNWNTQFPVWDDRIVARAGVQLASALHYIHVGWQDDHPLIHRDVTPSNIFCFEGVSVFKLGDFGISKLLDDASGRATSHVANWGFVAPELVRLGYSVPQSDLFQLGLVLCSMAGHKYAISPRLSTRAKVEAIASGAAHKAACALPTVDRHLRNVIKKLLIRNLANRYESAEEVHADLCAVARNLRATAP